MANFDAEGDEEAQRGSELKVVSTGNVEIDKKLGGGLPLGSLTLVEGESDSGKSVLSQQMVWGSLFDGFQVVLYPESTEGGRLVSILKWPEGAPLNLG